MSVMEVCRACLRSDGTLCSLLDSIGPTFDSPSDFVIDVSNIFNKMLIATDHKFPDKICTDCLDEIQKTYIFMLKCERSEDILKKMKKVQIHMKKLRPISTLRAIKSENDTYQNFLQIKNGFIGWDDTINGNDKKDVDRGEFQLFVHANIHGKIEPLSQHTLSGKNGANLGTELLDHLNCKDDVARDAIIQQIKQDPDLDISIEKDELLDISMEQDEFYGFESEVESSSKNVACTGCNFECKILETLVQHITETHMEGKICKLCNEEIECSASEHCSKHLPKSANNKENSINNSKKRTGKLSFKCKICKNAFISKQNLIVHSRNHRGKRIKCKICLKTFRWRQELECHLRIHTGERPFKCKSCSKTYRYRQDLVGHLRSHSGERPYKCESCSTTYIHKRDLMKHFKRHTGERPFKCEICSKAFKCRPNLSEHLKCHSAMRPFKCELCLRTFKRKSMFSAHSRNHIERPFTCESCFKTFKTQQDLMEHLNFHTRERPYNCIRCLKTFLFNRDLIRHLRCHTNE